MLLDNGQIALADKTPSGQLRVYRTISREEVASIITVFHAMFVKETGKAVLQLPHGKKQVLAITTLDLPEKAD